MSTRRAPARSAPSDYLECDVPQRGGLSLRSSYAAGLRFVASSVRLLALALALIAASCAPSQADLVPGFPIRAEITLYGPVPDQALQARSSVVDVVTVRTLQHNANALPPFPKGTIFCPFDDGSHYAIRFVYANGAALMLFAEIRGCQGVGPTYNGRWVRWSATDQTFLDDLERISPPG
jgi:hypothetical protein